VRVVSSCWGIASTRKLGPSNTLEYWTGSISNLILAIVSCALNFAVSSIWVHPILTLWLEGSVAC
jgi:hypothetical protein